MVTIAGDLWSRQEGVITECAAGIARGRGWLCEGAADGGLELADVLAGVGGGLLLVA